MSFTKLPSALKNALKLASFNKNCPEKCPEISPKISPEIGLAESGRPGYNNCLTITHLKYPCALINYFQTISFGKYF